MRFNVKRFMIGAILLASLSPLLQGCGKHNEPSAANNANNGITTKVVSGTVSDPATGLPLASAKVTAYRIDNGVAVKSPALSETVTSGADGSYTLHIPVAYDGSLLLEAVVSPAKLIDRLAKLLALPYSSTTIRAVVAADTIRRSQIPHEMISFATETVVLFIEQNIVNPATVASGFAAGGFSSDNIRKANRVLETLFGLNFAETPPPQSAAGTSNTKLQQDLLVSIKAINAALSNPGYTLADIVTKLATTGLGTIADDIKSAIATVTTQLIQAGTLPSTYVPSATINAAISNAQNSPVAPPSLSDTIPPTAPSGLSATPASSRAVTLAWTAASDNSGIVAGYLVYRADATGVYSFVDTVGGGANQLTITDFTASPGTAYSYKIVAFDAARNYSDASNIATVTTPPLANPADVNPPNTPVGLAIKWFTDTQVSIQWVQSTKTNQNGAVFPASGYYVYRNDQLIATVTGTSYIDTTQAATDYTYYIKAFDYAANVSPASTPITVRTLATAGAVLPAAPTGLVLAAATYNTVTLSWTASATAGVTYNIYRGADLVATGITSTQYSDSSVTPSSGYNYRVTAANAAGESTPSNILAVTVPANPNASQTAPSVPQNFALVTAATSTSVNLTWAPSTKSDGDRIIAGYDILRGDNTGSNFTVIDSVRTPGYTDTSVLPATTYTYKIDAFSTAGTRSAFSATITVTTALPVDTTDLTPPTAPTNLTLNSVTSSAVDLVWTASATSATGKKAAGYKVYRDGAQIADVATLEFVDATVAASSTYAYTVKSYDALGILSDSSNQVVATTPAQTTSTFSVSGRVTLNGIGLQGVVLTITGAGSGSTVTDTNGNYSFTQVRTGRYNVTPTLTPYQFQPGNQSVAVTIANVFAIDFAAAIPGSVTGNITYPVTSITSGILYPNGTIVNGITYPNSQVIGGITYPTSTVIGGVTYPTGAVTGGVSYPNGVVIGGVTYPPGTVVGGVAYPPGTVIGGVTYPPGTVSGGVGYPNGTVSGGVGYPNGMANGIVTYPDSAVTTSFLWSSIVTGRVVDNANSGAALPGATLTITDTTSTPVVTTITSGATGGYTFEGLANHSYTITASLGARTFVPATVTIGPVSGTGGIINVANIVAQ